MPNINTVCLDCGSLAVSDATLPCAACGGNRVQARRRNASDTTPLTFDYAAAVEARRPAREPARERVTFDWPDEPCDPNDPTGA